MFQVRLDKRFSNGFQFLTNFQWSFNEATRYRYASAPNLEYRIAGEDRRCVSSARRTTSCRSAKGKRIGDGAGPWLNRLIGGWQMAGILNLQSGGPANWEDRNVIYFGGDLQWDARKLKQRLRRQSI